LDTQCLERILNQVEKPTRYMGNEYNMVEKDPAKIDIRFAFAFPDVYEVGMSHLGMKILYHLLNERDDTYCERIFAPWIDMEQKMRECGIPLFALETKDSIADFDFIGFTLQYEMCYTNVLNMLDLADIPLLSEKRGEEYPIIIAGGPCAYNVEPLADFMDLVVMGEGEEVIHEILDLYKQCKAEDKGKKEFLLEAATKIKGVYVPAFYDVSYDDAGIVTCIKPNKAGVPSTIQKRIIKDLDSTYYPDTMIVPFMNIVHDRIMLEMFRGCTRGCRFCQAGMLYRPVRERSKDNLVRLANRLVKNTGYDEISLSSLSSSDYSQLEELCSELMEKFEPCGVSISLPSLRIDNFDKEFVKQVQRVRKSGLTFAPEAGTQRLRDVINKGVTHDDLMKSVHTAFELGWTSIKLYFMIGLPTETEEDIKGISILAEGVIDKYFEVNRGKRPPKPSITVSTSSFVPKPFTPFQWVGQDTMDDLNEKQNTLKHYLNKKYIDYNWHDSKVSYLEGVFARGDRRLGKVLVKAFKNGCKFDSWGDCFNFDAWLKAFDEVGLDPAFYANRIRNKDEIFPWDHIDVGVSRTYLWNEYEKALKGQLTPDCRLGCTGCGAIRLGGGACDALNSKI
jgi:radical SAM family uncharacterized protein